MVDLESFNDALIECVKAAGGSKKVGPLLFPEKAADLAQRALLACLNEDRPEKLSPDQTLFIMSLARKLGSNIGIEFLCDKLGYSIPSPIEPVDQVAQLQREFSTSVSRLNEIASRIESLTGAK